MAGPAAEVRAGDPGPADGADDPRRESLAAPWPALFGWVEQLTGGRVIDWRRQARWRPAWFLTVETAVGSRDLYVRCQREEAVPWTATLSLRREYDIMCVLHEQGVAAPAPLGSARTPKRS